MGFPGLAYLIGYLLVRVFPGWSCLPGIALFVVVPLGAGVLAPVVSRPAGIWAAAASALAIFAGSFVASFDQHAKLAAGYGWPFTLERLLPEPLVILVLTLAVAISVTLALGRRGG